MLISSTNLFCLCLDQRKRENCHPSCRFSVSLCCTAQSVSIKPLLSQGKIHNAFCPGPGEVLLKTTSRYGKDRHNFAQPSQAGHATSLFFSGVDHHFHREGAACFVGRASRKFPDLLNGAEIMGFLCRRLRVDQRETWSGEITPRGDSSGRKGFGFRL